MPAVDNPNALAASLPGQVADLRRQLKDLSVNRAYSPVSWHVGATGLIVDGPSTLTGAATLTGGVTGAVAATGAVSGTTLTSSGATSVGTGLSVGGDINLTGDLYSVHGLNTPVVSGYFAAYFNVDGRVGRTTSARRYKQEITAWTPDLQAVFALQLVTYRLKTAVAEFGADAPLEHGMIAEELVALGLSWLVTYINGEVEGIAYEKLALALLPAIQNHEKRLLALEAKP